MKTVISLPYPESEFNEFEQVSQIRQKPVQLSACLNLKTLNKNLSGTIFDLRIKLFKFCLRFKKYHKWLTTKNETLWTSYKMSLLFCRLYLHIR